MFFCRKLKGKYVTIPEELQKRIEKYYKERNVIRCDVIPSGKKIQRSSTQKTKVIETTEKNSLVKEIEEELKKKELTKSFQELLFKYIDERGLVDSDVYKKAYVDRRVFSKIRCDKNYHPSLGTIILLSLSLELSVEELENLLESASYSLPKNSESFIVIRYLFERQIYDIELANSIFYTVCHRNLSVI